MTGVSRRNFGIFRKLCGDNPLQNVVIVTNMWGGLTVEVGNQREAELTKEDDFFKPVLDKGARMARHENTVLSAKKITRLILGNHPLPLRIQEELVKEHMIISETSAGEELDRVINAQIKKHQDEIHILKEEIGQAMRDKDEEVRKALEDEMKGLQGKVEGLQEDRGRLESDYKQRIADLRASIRASKREKVGMRREIHRLSKIVNRPGIFSRIYSFIMRCIF
jgi:chromosome segregation ATPase